MKIVNGNQEQPFLASHPVYQYFARRYGLNLKSMHWEPDEMPGAKQWEAFDHLIKTHPAKWMIWEAQPDEEIEKQLAARGVKCVVFSPCGNVSPKGDYLEVMRANAQRLQATLGP